MPKYLKQGTFSFTISHVPNYGKIRIVSSDVNGRYKDDSIVEIKFNDIMNDKAFEEIRKMAFNV